MEDLTKDERIRLECYKAVAPTASKLDFSRDGAVEVARKAYEFVIEKSEKPSRSKLKKTG